MFAPLILLAVLHHTISHDGALVDGLQDDLMFAGVVLVVVFRVVLELEDVVDAELLQAGLEDGKVTGSSVRVTAVGDNHDGRLA